MASALLTLLNTLQAAFGAYNLYLSSISISNLRKYEEASKKAAEYSNTAEDQLNRTRTTQASCAAAILSTFLSSGYLLFASSSKFWGVVIAVANVGVLVVVRDHVGAFWQGKAKVPLPKMSEYNEAISKTQEVRLNMLYLAGSWVAAGVLALIS